MSEARSSPATAFPSPAFGWRSHPHSGWTWGGTGWGVDKGRSQSPPQRCPPPTWGGTGWGVDKGRSQSPPPRFPPPTWGGTGWGVDKGGSMSERSTAVTAALVLALGALACSGPESRIVDQYFTALRANDTNTLSSFAMVALDKKVDDWKVVSIGGETSEPAPEREMEKKKKVREADLAKNRGDPRAWANDLSIYPRLEQARE